MAEPVTALARQPSTAHAPYVVLSASEAMVVEQQLAFLAGMCHDLAPNRAFTARLTADILHWRLLGDPPEVPGELLAFAAAMHGFDETASQAEVPDEPLCGQVEGSRRCVEMAGHERAGYPHMWAGDPEPAGVTMDEVLVELATEDKHGSLDVAEWAGLQRQRRVAGLADEDGQ